MGLDGFGALKVGASADMILTRARNFTELLSRSHSDRTVLRSGALIDARLPYYAALDALTALGPLL